MTHTILQHADAFRNATITGFDFPSLVEANGRMRGFCAQAGMRLTEKTADHGLEWWVHEAPIEELDWSALTATAGLEEGAALEAGGAEAAAAADATPSVPGGGA